MHWSILKIGQKSAVKLILCNRFWFAFVSGIWDIPSEENRNFDLNLFMIAVSGQFQIRNAKIFSF